MSSVQFKFSLFYRRRGDFASTFWCELSMCGTVYVGLLDHHRSIVIERAHGVCAGWQEHNRNLWGFPQHHIAFEITPSPASYKKMDNKIFIFSAVYWLRRVLVSESNSIEAELLFISKVGVNVIPGDVFDWSTGGFLQG